MFRVTIKRVDKIGKAISVYRVFEKIWRKITTVVIVNTAVNQVNNMLKCVFWNKYLQVFIDFDRHAIFNLIFTIFPKRGNSLIKCRKMINNATKNAQLFTI